MDRLFLKKSAVIIFSLLLLSLFVTVLVIPTTAEGTSYSFWVSEEEYLAHPDRPSMVYSGDTLDPIVFDRGGYFLCNSDMKLTVDIPLSNGTTTIVDLNGHKLTASGSFTVGKNGAAAPTHLTVKNGSFSAISRSQAIKPQGNSTVLFDNLTVNAESSNSFIYGDGFRSVTFKDSVLNVNSGAKEIVFFAPPLSSWISSFASYDSTEDRGRTFKTHIVFDNSVFNFDSDTSTFLKVYDRANCGGGGIEVTFLSGSTFSSLDGNFYEYLDTNNVGLPAVINIEKGVKFTTPVVPIKNLDDNIEVKYYNSMDFNGKYLTYGEQTSLAAPDYVATEGEAKRLIFGYSFDPVYPHALCNEVVEIKLYSDSETEIPLDFMGYEGIADGTLLEYNIDALGLVTKPDEEGVLRVYNNVHVGWGTSPDANEYAKIITVSEPASYYAVFSDIGPATAVLYNSSDYTASNVSGACFDEVINYSDFEGVARGAHLVLFCDILLSSDIPVEISQDFTINLNGYSLTSDRSLNMTSSMFEVNGANLSILEGTISSYGIGIAKLDCGGKLTLSRLTAAYNTVPAFEVKNGEVNVSSSEIIGRSDDFSVPAFILARHGGNAVLNINDTDIRISGSLVSHLSTENSGNMTVNITGCEMLDVYSLFSMHQYSADTSVMSSVLNFTLKDSGVYSDKPFDIPVRSDYELPIVANITLANSYFTHDPRDTECGSFVFDDNTFVLAIEHESFNYVVSEHELSIKFNYEFASGLLPYVLVRASEEIEYVSTYNGRIAVGDLETVNIDTEEYYKLYVHGISPADALKDIKIGVGFKSLDVSYEAILMYSPIEYLEQLMLSDSSLDRKMACAIISYVDSVYDYAGSFADGRLDLLMASGTYVNECRTVDTIPTVVETDKLGNLGDAFTGASLYLSDTVSVRLNLRDDFSGTLNVIGNNYTVNDGKAGELNYIEVSLSLKDYYNTSICITGITEDNTDISGSYSLLDYLAACTDNVSLYNMIEALYAYSYEATVYNNRGIVPPYIETLPPMDVIIK